MDSTVLSIKDLRVSFTTSYGCATAVDAVSFDVGRCEKIGIVGESGCGKSVISKAIMGLFAGLDYVKVSGNIILDGEDLLNKDELELCDIRGRRVGMVFQEPMASLNPVFTIGNQLTETIMRHQKCSKDVAVLKAVEALELVGMPEPKTRLKQYPFQLSGGMRQRVMIAMAISCNPELLIADEPTTALDVTIQAQILELIKNLNKHIQTSLIIISHDLGVIADMADTVIVMYAGNIVERADVISIFKKPFHPYTQGLLNSIPHLNRRQQTLIPIEGTVPSIYNMPKGCRFNSRCKFRKPICESMEPPNISLGSRLVKCWLYDNKSKR
jgi:oligopeptide/dipeptide ABC transporter ATP-binding protein